MKFATAYAEFADDGIAENAKRAVEKIRSDFKAFPVSVLLYFASPDTYDPNVLADEMARAFPGARTFGCSSAGELCDDRMLWRSTTAMAFSDEVFEFVEIVAASGVDSNPRVVEELFASLESRTGIGMRDLNPREYVGMVLLDGMSRPGVEIMDRIGDLTDVVFFGGYAGDERNFVRTVPFLDGKTYENGVVIALMKPKGKWRVVKTQNIQPSDQSMVATRIDEANKSIEEFDGQPAALSYARAIGIADDRIPADGYASEAGKSAIQAYAESMRSRKWNGESAFAHEFLRHPLALMVDGEPFIRTAAAVSATGGLHMYMPPIKGMRYHLTRTTDIVEETGKSLDKVRRELGSIAAGIGVSCLLREIQVVTEGRCEEYGRLFSSFPFIGFSSYGEIYVGPINQTEVMLLFGE